MASTSNSTSTSTPDPAPVEVPPWLKSLPLAPQYSPTLSDFSDPISFIHKIEKEASAFGICKIVPPLPPPPKKSTLSNLNRSFTTRQQQIGFCPRRPRPVQMPVWQSGESYTLPQFEAKAKQFEKTQMKKFGRKSPFSSLEVEALFWKACADKPFSVEYANDVPGSGFGPAERRRRRKWCRDEEVGNVGESGWNMRGVSRAKGSLLRFMKEEIAGVTSPMVYVGMMFSWFAWHVEDHELHSLNYLHMGAGKTWYGVPRDAGPAFEEVVRVHGYGGEVNPLVTFTILGEKTTVMSPEVLIGAGIPCCRLVQNPGEFVVTFPGAYHSGFSHGFNCGEAANIATPEWLRVAKEAAIRRASINYPPMVSHFQLLYALALSLCSRMPISGVSEPRSSRLKDKMKGEGEMMVKEIFLQNVMETNELLSVLLDEGSSCIVLPQHSSSSPLCSNSLVRSQLKMKPRLSLGLCSREEALEASRNFPSSDVMLGKNSGVGHLNSFCSVKRNSMSVCQTSVRSDKSDTGVSDFQHVEKEKENPVCGDGLLDQGLFSCVTCGILSFTCVAVVHPSEEAVRNLMSTDCGFLNNQNIGSGEISVSGNNINRKNSSWDLVHGSGQLVSHVLDEDENKLAHNNEDGYDDDVHQGLSALALLASAYGNSSDSEEEPPASSNDARFSYNECSADYDNMHRTTTVRLEERGELKSEFSDGGEPGMVDNLEVSGEMETSSSSMKSMEEAIDDNSHQTDVEMGRMPSEQHDASYGYDSASVNGNSNKATSLGNFDNNRKDSMLSVTERYDKDSSRMHVFCLEHALEVDKLLRPLGGVNIMLLCHPDYPKIEEEAKILAEELGRDYEWKNIDFREATLKDQERIRAALEDEESIPTNSDWAVKLGINLYYSANLSKSLLYNKQMPYNAVIYRAFGCSSANNSPVKQNPTKRKPSRQKKIVVAGKWCGKVWMSNQVHPYLARREEREIAGKLLSQSSSDTYTNTNFKEVEVEAEQKRIVPKKNSSGNKISTARRSGKRKKKPLAREITKKPKSTPQVMDKKMKGSEIATQTPATQSGRVLRSCRKLNTKYEADEVVPSNTRSSRKLKDVKGDDGGSTDANGGPSTRLRMRSSKGKEAAKTNQTIIKKQNTKRKVKKGKADASPEKKDEEERVDEEYTCDIEGCSMSFSTKNDLALHKKDICPEEGCGKKFFSHKYLLQHRKVHMDDRPLECPWKGCKMKFKWAWARTEHIRVHTGDRPYVCRECDQTFRFVSDFSRHKRKTGHVVKKGKR